MKKGFKAFSLVEMLITIAILAIVLLIATQTLNTVFRVSTITKFKTLTKNEAGFTIELVERLLANSNIVDVYLYTPPDDDVSDDIRYYDEITGEIYSDLGDEELARRYQEGVLSSGDIGTELHIRPYGYNIWVCLGYFRGRYDNSKGYVVKRSRVSLPDGHASCFNTSQAQDYPVLVVNSQDVTVNDFQISYIQSTDVNNVFYVDLEMSPTKWVPGDEIDIKEAVIRQSVVTTKGLTWY